MPETNSRGSRLGKRARPGGEDFALGPPGARAGAAIHALVAACEPLDLNSVYAYLLLCEHFAQTCVHATSRGRTVGFVSAYRPPPRRDVIFVWQVAVAQEMRGRGLAAAMLRDLLERATVTECRYLETTISPSNTASMRLFHALARELDVPLTEEALFDETDFGDECHERELLIRIGPITGQQRGESRHES